jgi:hypothetical protein
LGRYAEEVRCKLSATVHDFLEQSCAVAESLLKVSLQQAGFWRIKQDVGELSVGANSARFMFIEGEESEVYYVYEPSNCRNLGRP